MCIVPLKATVSFLFASCVSHLFLFPVRPIVAYMNTNWTQLPLLLNFRQSLRVYDGAWYPQDAELFDEISKSVYVGLQRVVLEHRQANSVRALLWKVCTLIGINEPTCPCHTSTTNNAHKSHTLSNGASLACTHALTRARMHIHKPALYTPSVTSCYIKIKIKINAWSLRMVFII